MAFFEKINDLGCHVKSDINSKFDIEILEIIVK